VASGCTGNGRAPGERSSSSVATVAPSREVFDRWAYSFVLPDGWTIQERGTEDWPTGLPPHRDTHVFDTFVTPERDPWIVVGRRPVGPDESLTQWIAQMVATGTISYPPWDCGSVEDERAATLDKEAAHLRAFHCPVDGPNAIAVQVLALHRGGGWVVQCFSEQGKGGPIPAFEEQCQRWLQTFHFLK
jgi:hypothetical protein